MTDTIFGIDLGTTNSCLAVMEPGGPRVLPIDGELIVPSVVSLDRQTGRFLVGRRARNRQVLEPASTVRSIKRRMGETTPVRLGDRELLPEVVASCGNNQLGGDDFDRLLADDLAERLRQKTGRDLPPDLRLEARLLDAAERAKIDLSSRPFARVMEEALLAGVHLDLEIDRR